MQKEVYPKNYNKISYDECIITPQYLGNVISKIKIYKICIKII